MEKLNIPGLNIVRLLMKNFVYWRNELNIVLDCNIIYKSGYKDWNMFNCFNEENKKILYLWGNHCLRSYPVSVSYIMYILLYISVSTVATDA